MKLNKEQKELLKTFRANTMAIDKEAERLFKASLDILEIKNSTGNMHTIGVLNDYLHSQGRSLKDIESAL